MTNQDDLSTLILDFDSIKEHLGEQEDILGVDEAQELEFSTEETQAKPAVKPQRNTLKLYLFSYQTNYFKKNKTFFKENSSPVLCPELKDLNQVISKQKNATIVFYYNDSPKVINQLSMQIRTKFPSIRTIIIAKNLSEKKALAHKNSQYGASFYLAEPFSVPSFNEIVKNL